MGSFKKPFALGYQSTFYRNSSGYILNAGWNIHGTLGHNGRGIPSDNSTGYSKFTYANTSGQVQTSTSGTGVSTFKNALDYDNSDYHSAIVTSSGAVYTAGYGPYGELGNGSTDRQYFYGTTTITSGAKAVHCGSNSTFVLKTDGSVWATGEAGRIGMSSNQSSFVQIVSSTTASSRGGVVDIVGSRILYGNGDLYTSSTSGWTKFNHPEGHKIKLIDGAFFVDEYRNIYHSLTKVLDSSQVNGDPIQVWGANSSYWGYLNSKGELYLKGPYANSSISTPFRTGVSYFDVYMNPGFTWHYAYLSTSGDFYLWGTNDVGQLGDGTKDTRPSPALLASGLTKPTLPVPAYIYGISATPPATKNRLIRRLIC